MDMWIEKGPYLSNQRRINGRLVRIHTTGHSREAISTEQAVKRPTGSWRVKAADAVCHNSNTYFQRYALTVLLNNCIYMS